MTEQCTCERDAAGHVITVLANCPTHGHIVTAAAQLHRGRSQARAANVALQDQVIATLRDEYPLPISTRALCERMGVHRYDDTGIRVYRILHRLAGRDELERIRVDGHYDVYWRTWSGQER